MAHIPVLLNEVIELLNPKNGEFFIDGTFGAGGHSKKILEMIGEKGLLLAFDWDPSTELRANKKVEERNESFLTKKNVIFVNDNFTRIKDVLQEKKLPKADGLLLDLGFSSDQLSDSGKGFSFKKDEPLIMSYSENGLTAYEVINSYSEEDIEGIIKDLGEERFSKRITKAIINNRKKEPIKTSFQLAKIIRNAVPGNYERRRIDPATRTFQALRIFINSELENLKAILDDLELILKKEGRVVIISFHSIEDRIVKNYLRNLKNEK
ncbi:MAG: 16S rRNA (cytosine(1402)-N(4))-methyltransferase RsmH, partial [Nanoarchaeota archaeon]|nr:16S rRNA (cytosine(1402)-N(4))-methyltransferase RsmH [Nanoarchaeota archaeon]